MKRKEVINQIVDSNLNYYMGYAMSVVPDEFVKWMTKIIEKLDNASLSKEAKKCGIKITKKELDNE